VLAPLEFYWFMTFRLLRFLKLKYVDLISILDSSISRSTQIGRLTPNPANGLNILYVNGTFCRQPEYTQEHIIGLTLAVHQGSETSSLSQSRKLSKTNGKVIGTWSIILKEAE
jgi:hypothetical protein